MPDDIKVNLTLKDIYDVLCSDCKKKLQALTKDKIAEELAKRALEV